MRTRSRRSRRTHRVRTTSASHRGGVAGGLSPHARRPIDAAPSASCVCDQRCSSHHTCACMMHSGECASLRCAPRCAREERRGGSRSGAPLPSARRVAHRVGACRVHHSRMASISMLLTLIAARVCSHALRRWRPRPAVCDGCAATRARPMTMTQSTHSSRCASLHLTRTDSRSCDRLRCRVRRVSYLCLHLVASPPSRRSHRSGRPTPRRVTDHRTAFLHRNVKHAACTRSL
jgi:hypothetical protein